MFLAHLLFIFFNLIPKYVALQIVIPIKTNIILLVPVLGRYVFNVVLSLLLILLFLLLVLLFEVLPIFLFVSLLFLSFALLF